MYNKLRKRLLHAAATETMVRLRRSVAPEWVCGYVLDVGPKWLILAVVEDASRFNGFEFYRLRDVIELEADPHVRFHERALALRGLTRPTKPEVCLDTTREILASASAAFPLVTVHREHLRPGACWIGQVLALGRTRLVLRTIDPHAVWDDDEPARFRYSDITRIDLGGEYEASLDIVAAAEPA